MSARGRPAEGDGSGTEDRTRIVATHAALDGSEHGLRDLLNTAHPRGRSKAKFFMGRGFTMDDPNALAASLFDHAVAHWPDLAAVQPQGASHGLVGPLRCPTGRPLSVRPATR